jgi:aminoglycoside phosphotransferase family enzyme/predicted kinase
MTDRAPITAIVDRLRAGFERRDRDAATKIYETHISIVLLAGRYAYKFKKPVDLGFLDFSTLERRHHFCEREVALNRRYAPTLYEGVVTVTGDPTTPELGGSGQPLDYAVKMRRFDNDSRLDAIVESGHADAEEFAELGRNLAATHATAAEAPDGSSFGTAPMVHAQILATHEHLDAVEGVAPVLDRIAALSRDLHPTMTARRAAGHVRDCHGDLHLSNLVRLDGELVSFDCIEFSDELRFIDTINDIAFLIMDLDARRQSEFANVVLNSYLNASGDFDGLKVLRLYCAYRALVRAKVANLQLATAGDAAVRQACTGRRTDHLEVAASYLAGGTTPGLIITHGLSGSGKTRFSHALAAHTGFIHVRSDLERRRIAGFGLDDATGSRLEQGGYRPELTVETYRRLATIAEQALSSGYSIIIDATFLKRARRRPFLELSRRLGVPFHILDFEAPKNVLQERIAARSNQGGDASEATFEVLDRQITTQEMLGDDERAFKLDARTIDLKATRGDLAQRLGCTRY